LKIISLNTWGGRALHPLMHFFKRHGPTTDIFCLQEMHDTTREYRESHHPDEYVRWDQLELTRKVLPGHDGYFARWADNPDRMSVATFVRHNVSLAHVGTHVVHRPHDVHEVGSAVISPRKLQYVRIDVPGWPSLTVVNYHGMWRDTGKRDSPERIVEMRSLSGFLRSVKGALVLCGDLNLDPDTQAIALLTRQVRLQSLIDTKTVPGTRTPLYRHTGDSRYSSFADYIFLRDVTEDAFTVMPDVVSDHAALYVDVPWGV
jgi:endonuclease/exonuclease/phosphatase family metal-dependent hydrolase